MTISQSARRPAAFSAEVRLTLTIDDHDLDLVEAGPFEVVLKHAQEVPIGPAQLTLTIDGAAQTKQICIAGQGDDMRTIQLANS